MARLVRGVLPAESLAVHWSGQDDRGRAVASGVYLYRLTAGEQAQTRALALVR